MDSKTIISIIQNVGFPITISVYLLVRMEMKIDQLTTCISDLARIIEAK
ncbi:MAG: YvrJ family protein [Peptostreptococcus sp.]